MEKQGLSECNQGSIALARILPFITMVSYWPQAADVVVWFFILVVPYHCDLKLQSRHQQSINFGIRVTYCWKPVFMLQELHNNVKDTDIYDYIVSQPRAIKKNELVFACLINSVLKNCVRLDCCSITWLFAGILTWLLPVFDIWKFLIHHIPGKPTIQ